MTDPRYQVADNLVRYYRDQPCTVMGRWRAGSVWMYDIRIESTRVRIDAVPETALEDR